MKYFACAALMALFLVAGCTKTIEVEKVVEKPVEKIVEVEKVVEVEKIVEVEKTYDRVKVIGVTTDGEIIANKNHPKLKWWIVIDYDLGDLSQHVITLGDGELIVTIFGVNARISVEEFFPVDDTPSKPAPKTDEGTDEF